MDDRLDGQADRDGEYTRTGSCKGQFSRRWDGGPENLRTDRLLAPSDSLKRPFHEHNLEAASDIGFLDLRRLTVSPVSPGRSKQEALAILFAEVRSTPHAPLKVPRSHPQGSSFQPLSRVARQRPFSIQSGHKGVRLPPPRLLHCSGRSFSADRLAPLEPSAIQARRRPLRPPRSSQLLLPSLSSACRSPPPDANKLLHLNVILQRCALSPNTMHHVFTQTRNERQRGQLASTFATASAARCKMIGDVVLPEVGQRGLRGREKGEFSGRVVMLSGGGVWVSQRTS